MSERRITVNISDARVSDNPSDVLVTFSLGSCIGVCLYDRAAHLGGMLHYLLPNSAENPERAKEKPFMYADTGMKILLEERVSMGTNKKRVQVKIAGGAATLKVAANGFDIGKRNYLAIRKILWKNGMFIDAEDVGGTLPRTLCMSIADGAVAIRFRGLEKNL